MDNAEFTKDPPLKAYDIPSFTAAYNIGRSTTYREMREGRLGFVKVGSRTLIPVEAAERWLNSYS